MTLLKRLRHLVDPQQWVRRSVETRYALLEACLIGVVSALAALLLKEGINYLGLLRLQFANSLGAPLALPLFGLFFGLLAGWGVERFSPAAMGGGIPQIKAVLAQHPLPLSLRVAVVKLIGTIMVLGAGLTLGRRGPTVHIGAALAGAFSQWLPTAPEHRRRMIAAGAAAGLAAGFDTPIAGVMFVIEELMRDVSNLTLETAILASFTGAIVSRVLGLPDVDNPEMILDADLATSFSTIEIPVFLLLGIFAGLLGGIFNKGILFSLEFNRKLQLPMSVRVGLAGLISGIIVAFLPPFFRDNAGLRDFLITGELSWQVTALVFVAHFCLTLLAYGSGAPGGLFAPALVLGSALGFLVGTGEMALLGYGSVNTYALVGMGAFFTGVVRVPVTAIIIIFEITADFDLVLPLMIACATAYGIGEWVQKGSIYQHLLEFNHINLKEEGSGSRLLETVKAQDVMQRKVETLSSQITIDEAREAFSNSNFRGFPIVEAGKLVGILTQRDMAKVKATPGIEKVTEIMTPKPVTAKPDTSLSHILYLLDRYHLSHLPVMRGGRLMGLITRGDIIRTEADLLSGKTPQIAARPESSYVVYVTRSPGLGKGRILLPIANPDNVEKLLQMAIAIAQYYDYDLQCLQVINIPRHTSPNHARVRTVKQRRLLRKAERMGQAAEVGVHTQIRVSHDPAQAILETITEEQVDLILMGWKGDTSTPGRIFGGVVDTVIRQAPCDVVVVKFGEQFAWGDNHPRTSWLIPVAGGPNAKRALELLPALTKETSKLTPSRLWLCQVHSPHNHDADFSNLEETAKKLRANPQLQVITAPLRSDSVAGAIIALVQQEKCNFIMIGASREGLLQQAIHGNIPEMITRGVEGTVILVRSAQD